MQPARFVSHRIQRLQDERAVRVLFWAQDASGHSHLAVVGTDTRRSGHFTYVSMPDLEDVLGFQPLPLKVTNRNDVMNWLEKLGARQVAIDLPESSLPHLDASQMPTQAAELQASKRKSRPAAGAGGKASGKKSGGGSAAPRRAPINVLHSGQLFAPCMPPTAKALVAFSTADPALLAWISHTPDDATISEFFIAADDLSGLVAEKSAALTVPEAAGILDRLLKRGEASLQLLEATNISPTIGRLRGHPNAMIARRAEELARRWHGVAAATLAHAQRHIDAGA